MAGERVTLIPSATLKDIHTNQFLMHTEKGRFGRPSGCKFNALTSPASAPCIIFPPARISIPHILRSCRTCSVYNSTITFIHPSIKVGFFRAAAAAAAALLIRDAARKFYLFGSNFLQVITIIAIIKRAMRLRRARKRDTRSRLRRYATIVTLERAMLLSG